MAVTKNNPDEVVKSVGTYTSGLPFPRFSPDNPHWKGHRFEFIHSKFRPRYNAVDFLYATVWEVHKPFDVVTALFVRQATVRTAKLDFLVVGIKAREQFRNKENVNAKST